MGDLIPQAKARVDLESFDVRAEARTLQTEPTVGDGDAASGWKERVL